MEKSPIIVIPEILASEVNGTTTTAASLETYVTDNNIIKLK